MIRDRDFVFTGMQPWDITIGSNAKDIAKEISKNNRVLYVNTPLDILTYRKKENTSESIHRRKVIKKELPALRQLSPTLWILDFPFTILPINKLPDGVVFDFFNYLNNRKMYHYVLSTLKKLGFKNFIYFIDNDVYRSFYASDILKPSYSIYYRRDNLTSTFWRKHVARLEPKICKKSNIVLANSIYLANMVRSHNNNSFDVGQGVDLTDYNPDKSYPIPDYLQTIKHPIIGYTGWITSRRLDANLLYQTAKACSDYSFVFVGKEDCFFSSHIIHTLPNVYFTGEKPSIQMPSCIAAFDICINPQLINEVTIGNYPRKIDEYLALGKQVIATKTETMNLFEAHVWNCSNATEYIQAIHQIQKGKEKSSFQERIKFAQSHSWTNSVEKIYSHIQ